jgi:hypothetical protein
VRRASETLGLGARNLVASRAGIALRGNEMKWLSMILIGFPGKPFHCVPWLLISGSQVRALVRPPEESRTYLKFLTSANFKKSWRAHDGAHILDGSNLASQRSRP